MGRWARVVGGVAPRRLGVLVSLMMLIPAALATTARADTTPSAATPLTFGGGYRIDNQTPFAHPWGIRFLSCPTATMCAALDQQGNLLTTTDPTSSADTWSSFSTGMYIESGVACPTASFCVAVGDVDGTETVFTSTDPTGGADAWESYAINDGWMPDDLTCPTASFCAALGPDETILTTTDPAGGAGTWQSTTYSTNTGAGGESLTCASASLCLIGTTDGVIYSSTDPAGGSGAWMQSQVMPVSSFSCPTAHLCAGVGFDGLSVAVSTDPAGGAGAWTVTALDNTANSNGSPQITCTPSSFCVALDPDGSVATTHDPEGGASAWSTVAQTPVPSNDAPTWSSPVACPDDNFCVVSVGVGDMAVSASPAGPPGSWPSLNVDGYNLPTGVSCISDALCVAVDDAGNVLTSTQPQARGFWDGRAHRRREPGGRLLRRRTDLCGRRRRGQRPDLHRPGRRRGGLEHG